MWNYMEIFGNDVVERQMTFSILLHSVYTIHLLPFLYFPALPPSLFTSSHFISDFPSPLLFTSSQISILSFLFPFPCILPSFQSQLHSPLLNPRLLSFVIFSSTSSLLSSLLLHSPLLSSSLSIVAFSFSCFLVLQLETHSHDVQFNSTILSTTTHYNSLQSNTLSSLN
jgi:hypothetical protein